MSSGTGKLEEIFMINGSGTAAGKESSLLTSIYIRQHDLEVLLDCRARLLEQGQENLFQNTPVKLAIGLIGI